MTDLDHRPPHVADAAAAAEFVESARRCTSTALTRSFRTC